jgi:hypothetical protein
LLIAFNKGYNNRAASVISYGLYGSNLKKWVEAYGEDKFLILTQNEVGDELSNVLQRCLIHIGVAVEKQDFLLVDTEESNVGIYDPSILKIARIASIIKTKPLQGTNRRIPRLLPFRVLGTLVSRCLEFTASRVTQKKEHLNNNLKIKLQDIYIQDSKILSLFINK